MGWIKLDDSMPEHPKIIGLPDSAFRLYVSLICYAGRLKTDGKISEKAMKNIEKTLVFHKKKSKKTLVFHGLLREVEGGYEIVNFLEYQQSKHEIERKQELGRKRQRRHRANGNALVTRTEEDIDIDKSTVPVVLPRKESTNSPPRTGGAVSAAALEAMFREQVDKAYLDGLASGARSKGKYKGMDVEAAWEEAKDYLRSTGGKRGQMYVRDVRAFLRNWLTKDKESAHARTRRFNAGGKSISRAELAESWRRERERE